MKYLNDRPAEKILRTERLPQMQEIRVGQTNVMTKEIWIKQQEHNKDSEARE